jgi:molecular chaperone GrpE
MNDEIKTTEVCAKCDEYLAGWKRALADYDNLKKETERDRRLVREIAIARSAEGLLRLCDQMDMAIRSLPPDPEGNNPYMKGIQIFRSHCEQELKQLGMESFGEVGDVFDPNIHEAIAPVTDETKPDQTVVEVSQRGWKMGDRIVRSAKVIVNNYSGG